MTRTVDLSKPLDLSLFPDDREAELLQQLYCLLMTDKGSVPCYRDYGVDTDWLHRPINAARSAYAVAIHQAVQTYLPTVKVNAIRFTAKALEPDHLYPVLEVTFLE